jgi:aerobic-type carbon monoxide dehydrogenase small subunit (CoxS/CutS family)
MSEHETWLTIHLNGERRSEPIDSRMLLVEALREVFGTPGPKLGCASGDCGACTVLIDGDVEKACLRLAVGAQGAAVRTLEDMAHDPRLSVIQQAFWDEHGFQCGFCLSGMLWCAADLLAQTPDPSDEQIRDSIGGNLCRCTGYVPIIAASREAGVRLRSMQDSLANHDDMERT